MIYLATSFNMDNDEMYFYYENGDIHLLYYVGKMMYHYAGTVKEMVSYTEEMVSYTDDIAMYYTEFILPETKRYILTRQELPSIIDQIIFDNI